MTERMSNSEYRRSIGAAPESGRAGDRMTADEYQSYLAREALAKVREHKYGAVRTTVDGIEFDSKAEARRYGELRLLEAQGEIRDLVLQPSYLLQEAFQDAWGNTYRAIHYRGDFGYFEVASDRTVVEDTKGFETPVWRVKQKLFAHNYPHIELRATGRN